MPYIDNLMAYRCFTHVGIFDQNSGACWASTPNFPISPDQLKNVALGFKDISSAQKGVVVDNEKFMFIRSDPGSSILYKKGANGAFAQKAKLCIIIGIHDEKVKAEHVTGTIGKMVDYLISIGY